MDDDSQMATTPIQAPTDALPAPAARPPRSLAAGTAGVLTAVLALLGIGMLVAQVAGAAQHHPGPGALTVAAHMAGAVLGIWCYRLATRRSGLVRWLGFAALPVMIAALLWVFWWSPT